MLNHIALMQKHGVKQEELSHSLRRLSQSAIKLEEILEQSREELNAPDISDKKRETLSAQIQEGEETLQSRDEELCHKIENVWLPNREAYRANAERLKASRTSKASKAVVPAPPPPPPPPVEEPIVPQPEPVNTNTPPVEPEPAPPPPAPPAEPAKTSEPKKEGSIGWGWVIGAAAMVAAAFFGINYYQNKH
jgi:hypothetical protein